MPAIVDPAGTLVGLDHVDEPCIVLAFTILVHDDLVPEEKFPGPPGGQLFRGIAPEQERPTAAALTYVIFLIIAVAAHEEILGRSN